MQKVAHSATRHLVTSAIWEGQPPILTHIGGHGAAATPWILDVSEAIAGMEAGRWAFFLRFEAREIPLFIAVGGGRKTLVPRGENPELLRNLPRPEE